MSEDSNSWMAWGIPIIVVASIGIASGHPVLIIIAAVLLLIRKYLRGPMYKGNARMDGKVVVITGANTGIGFETARDLARRGAHIIFSCRDMEKAARAKDAIKAELPDATVDLFRLDLASLASVRVAAEQIKGMVPKIHVLINNAGIMACPEWKTADDFEMQLGTNHLGHFLFTLLLIENIKAATPSRIITVSSLAHTFDKMHLDNLQLKGEYSPMKAYSQSKLANILFSRKLAEKLQGTGVTTYVLHPGIVSTELTRHMEGYVGQCLGHCLRWLYSHFIKTPVLGAQTSIYCAVDEKLQNITGKYYSDCAEKTPSRRARSDDDAERLWNISLELVGLDSDGL